MRTAVGVQIVQLADPGIKGRVGDHLHGACWNDSLSPFRWSGKCWHIQNLLKYEFDIEFDVSKRKGYSWEAEREEGQRGMSGVLVGKEG